MGESSPSLLELVKNLFAIVGVIASVIEVYNFVRQRRSNEIETRISKEINDIVKRNVVGKIAEDDIRRLRERFAALEEQIEDVPRKATLVFMQEQQDSLRESIGAMYDQYRQLTSRLEQQVDNRALDRVIQDAIEREIVPSYIRRQRQQQLVIWLVIIILGLLIVPIPPLVLLIPIVSDLVRFATAPDTQWISISVIGAFVLSVPLLIVPARSLNFRIVSRKRQALMLGLLLVVVPLPVIEMIAILVWDIDQWSFLALWGVSILLMAIGCRTLLVLLIDRLHLQMKWRFVRRLLPGL